MSVAAPPFLQSQGSPGSRCAPQYSHVLYSMSGLLPVQVENLVIFHLHFPFRIRYNGCIDIIYVLGRLPAFVGGGAYLFLPSSLMDRYMHIAQAAVSAAAVMYISSSTAPGIAMIARNAIVPNTLLALNILCVKTPPS